jgi:hypothetical protein
MSVKKNLTFVSSLLRSIFVERRTFSEGGR